MLHGKRGILLAGMAAGMINGLLGAGGGMVLVPLLTLLTDLDDNMIFPSSISIIAPMCLISLTISAAAGNVPWRDSLPYLLGSGAGGAAAGLWGRKIPILWLHRALGALILWGGARYLWE